MKLPLLPNDSGLPLLNLETLNRLGPEHTKALHRSLVALRNAKDARRREEWRPQDQQRPFHQSQAQFRLILGGNRSGKSDSGAIEATDYMMGRHPYRRVTAPNHGWIVVEDLTVAKDVIIPKINSLLPPQAIKSFNKHLGRWELYNGSTAQIKTTEADPRKFESAGLRWIWCDEEPPQEHWEALITRTGEEQLDIWLTMTPLNGIDWSYDELYCNQVPGEIEVFTYLTADNIHVPLKERERLRKRFEHTEHGAARLRGEYVGITGLVYKQWNEQRHFIDPITIPRWWPHILIIDPHMNKPSRAALGAISPENVRYLMQEFKGDENFVIKDMCRRMEEAIGDRRIFRRLIDPSSHVRIGNSGNTTLQDVFAAEGFPTKDANNDFFYGMDATNTMLKEGKLFVFKTCPDTAWQMKHVAYRDPRKKGGEEGPAKQKKKNDDMADITRYFAAERIEFENEPEQLAPPSQEALPGETGY